MAKRLVIANWKMYINSPEVAQEFGTVLKRKTAQYRGAEAWIAPPFPCVSTLSQTLRSSSIKIGAQNISAFDDPKHTGEISGSMLKNSGASFCLVGHSERRAIGESNEVVHQQLLHAAQAGLIPVLCMGEVERPSVGTSDGDHFSFIAEQLRSALLPLPKQYGAKLIVVYEPVWAIGKTAQDAMKPAELEEMVIFIKKTIADVLGRAAALRVPVLYGGSVEPGNAAQLIKEGGVNGFLVGHASVEADSFLDILKSCRK